MSSYNSIVIGAGHNGLVCATYLAQSGQRVLLLEAGDDVGGLASAREFLPGFRVSVAHSISHFSGQVANDLNLAAHGFDPTAAPAPLVAYAPNRDPIVIDGDSITGVTDADTAAYPTLRAELKQYADALAPSWLDTIPRIGSRRLNEVMTFARVGLRLRRMGKQAMAEFLRVASLPARDLVDERFDDDLLKAALCWDGLIGSRMAPRSPNSAVLAMMYRMSEANLGQHVLPQGGVRQMATALRSAAEAAGVEIRTQSAVKRIQIAGDENGQRIAGVELTDGTVKIADTVVSAVDPKQTFLKLVGVKHLDIEFTNRIHRIRANGLVAKLHLALSDLPKFRGVDRPDGRMIIAESMDAIEFAYDDSKYGENSANPVVECVISSLHDEASAPSGQHVLSAHVMFVPYALKGGWTDDARQTVAERAIDTIAVAAPGIRDLIRHTELLTPADLEAEFGAVGGHWHHGEFAMDQMLMMRPTYGAAQYSTPIPGLFLASAGSHPGGDLVGAAGHNAAQAVLR